MPHTNQHRHTKGKNKGKFVKEKVLLAQKKREANLAAARAKRKALKSKEMPLQDDVTAEETPMTSDSSDAASGSSKNPPKVDDYVPSQENGDEDFLFKDCYRRIVTINVLASELWCKKCDRPLSLLDFHEEHRDGLASTFAIHCKDCYNIYFVCTDSTYKKDSLQKNPSTMHDVSLQEDESSSFTFKYSRAMINLNVLPKELWCKKCDKCLSLLNTVGEVIEGLAHIFQVKCKHCHDICIVHTDEYNEEDQSYDINKKIVLGIKKADITLTQINIMFIHMDLPPVTYEFFKKFGLEKDDVSEEDRQKRYREAVVLKNILKQHMNKRKT